MAAKGVFYGVKHPRLVTLRQTIGVIDTYITKLRAAGQRVNQCTLASSLIHSAYLVDVQLVQLASAYLSRHPRRRSLGKQLAIYQQAAQAAQTKCKGTSKATSSSPAGGTR